MQINFNTFFFCFPKFLDPNQIPKMCSGPANFDYHMPFLLQQIAIQCPFICVQGLFYSSMFIAMHIIFKDDGVVNCIFFTYILKCVENAQESKQRRTEENNYGS